MIVSQTAVCANGRISFELNLEPSQAWPTCLLYELGDGKVRAKAPDEFILNIKP
jgi:hypothetical protein